MHVTVLMAVYNNITTVESVINSIEAQTYNDWDLLIVDDFSCDGTYELLLEAVGKRRNITVLRNLANLGLAESLNKGGGKARGELIARMDADDFCYPQRIARQVEFFKKHPGVDVLGAGAELINEHGKTLSFINMPERHDDIKKVMYKQCPLIHPTIMMRKSFFDVCGGYDKKIRWGQDYELWARSITKFTFHNLQEPLIRYQTRSYKRSLRSILYRFYVQLRVAVEIKELTKGFFSASLNLTLNILHKLSLYTPNSLRRIK